MIARMVLIAVGSMLGGCETIRGFEHLAVGSVHMTLGRWTIVLTAAAGLLFVVTKITLGMSAVDSKRAGPLFVSAATFVLFVITGLAAACLALLIWRLAG
jgi:hypothetical protein